MYGAFINQVRRSRGLSQGQLAEITGISQPNLSAYENDRQLPSIDTLNKLLVGCGYLLEAVAGDKKIVCPLPCAGWFADEDSLSHDNSDVAVVTTSRAGAMTVDTDLETRAAHIEQVLALSDALRESKALQ